jgi:hypothetical protein
MLVLFLGAMDRSPLPALPALDVLRSRDSAVQPSAARCEHIRGRMLAETGVNNLLHKVVFHSLRSRCLVLRPA